MKPQDLLPRMNRYITWKPTLRQLAFMALPHREILFGGAVGGAKSIGLMLSALQYFDIPGYSALILRTTRSALEQPGGLIPRSHEMLQGTGAKWHGNNSEWTSPEGGKIRFGYLEAPRDKFRYASSEYQFIGFEELTEWRTGEDYRFMSTRMRRPKRLAALGVPIRKRATTNPIGPGFQWVKEHFVDRPNTSERCFLPSLISDNPHLDSEEYLKSLADLPPAVRLALENGQWIAGEPGLIFDKNNFKYADAAQAPTDWQIRVRYWDFAATKPSETNRDPDFLVGTLLGKDRKNRWWILDVERHRLGPKEVEKVIKSTAQRDGKDVYIGIEQEGGSQAKIAVNYFATQVLNGYSVEYHPASNNKIVRAGPFATQVEAQNVYVVRAVWNHAFADEHDDFPNVAHDDQVDSASGGFNHAVSLLSKIHDRSIKKPYVGKSRRRITTGF